MHCSNCDASVLSGSQACTSCGAALEQVCLSCSQTNPPSARFCMGCGTELGLRLADGASVSRHLKPKQPERRPLTVIFCDLADSTQLSTQLDPEDYRDTIVNYQQLATREIERFGGFVAKYMGDGIVAYFGYPSALEDDAERAIRASLSLVQAVSEQACVIGPLCVRVGIASGPVIIGDLIGEGSARENAIAGETPNLAARLQILAEKGGVVISQSSRALVGDLFEYDALGPLRIKGFDEPQAAFKVQRPNDRLSRFEALRSPTSPLVGRQEELSVLIRRWNRTRHGDPQIVLLSAEAGIGKSRLAASFRHWLRREPHQVATAYCAPVGRDSAFYPFIRALEDRCGFTGSDPPEKKLDSVELLAASVFEHDPLTASSLLAELLSLDGAKRYPPLTLSPQQRLKQTTQVVAETILAPVSSGCLLFFIEDIHWIDPSSLEVLRVICRKLAEGMPMMLVMSFRPEFRPPSDWLGKANVTPMTLSRLRDADAELVVGQLAGSGELDEVTVRQILDHADGVPLFIEEITRAVIEGQRGGRRVAPAELTVPATLQASLLGRLDRLSKGREIAQVGSAIGRTFSRALLVAVTDHSERELDSALDELIRADLLMAAATDAPTFIFRHALIQDIAYGAMLRTVRRTLHDRIASALIERFPVEADARPELLARHLIEGGRTLEAIAAWRRAAVKALRGGAWKEGLRQLEAAIAGLLNLPESESRNRTELDLQMMAGGVAMGAIGHSAPAAQLAYQRAYDLARTLDETHTAALAGSRLWIAEYGAGDLVGVRNCISRIIEELNPGRDSVDQALIRSALVTAYLFEGRFVDAQRIVQETVNLLNSVGSDVAPTEYYYMSPKVQTSTALMALRLFEGHQNEWHEACEAIYAELEHIGPVGGVINLTVMIYIRYLARDWERLRADLGRFEAMVSQIGGADLYLDLPKLVRSRLQTLSGRREGLAGVSQVMTGTAMNFAMQHLPRYQMIAGDAHADLGDVEGARSYFLAALKGGPHGSQHWLRSEVLRRLGDLAAPGDPGLARQHYEDALATARAQSSALFEIRAAIALTRLDRGGRGAIAELSKIIAKLEGDGPDFEEARALIAAT